MIVQTTISKETLAAIVYINDQIGITTGKALDLDSHRVKCWFMEALLESGENFFKYQNSGNIGCRLQFRLWQAKMLKYLLIRNEIFKNDPDRNNRIQQLRKHFEYEIHQLQWEIKNNFQKA